MSYGQILASLTTNPARRFGYSNHKGRIAKGMDADLVVLNADPAQDAAGFSRVRYTFEMENSSTEEMSLECSNEASGVQ